jgi:uncharacterized protein
MSGSYIIQLSGLTEGRHIFDFEIDKKFFEKFEESEIENGSLIAHIEMDRRSNHLDLAIDISGSVKISCDRCLEIFSQPIDCKNRLLVKYGKSIEDTDPDIFTIPVDEHELDLKQHIYEFIYLALPIKRVHPDDKGGKSTCNHFMLEKLGEYTVEEVEEIDPRWDELKKLFNDN